MLCITFDRVGVAYSAEQINRMLFITFYHRLVNQVLLKHKSINYILNPNETEPKICIQDRSIRTYNYVA